MGAGLLLVDDGTVVVVVDDVVVDPTVVVVVELVVVELVVVVVVASGVVRATEYVVLTPRSSSSLSRYVPVLVPVTAKVPTLWQLTVARPRAAPPGSTIVIATRALPVQDSLALIDPGLLEKAWELDP